MNQPQVTNHKSQVTSSSEGVCPTIYALSTVFGKSGVAVIRISGPNAHDVITAMTSLDTQTIQPRQTYLVNLLSPSTVIASEAKQPNQTNNQYLLDKCLLVYFQAPHSFTGEDIIELHTHGSKAVINSVFKALSQLPNYRLAEPGEFSKRAFYNNKMDLTEAEGLADLIDSETAEQQKYALQQMEGNLKNLYDGWREDIIGVLSYLEAYIDFPEEDIPESLKDNISNTVFKLKDNIQQHLNSDSIGERLRDGFRVVIVGEPNVGKSSLLNIIAKRDAVIVSDIAGTTRDAIDIHLDIKGYPVIFTDTAGLRETDEEIEQKGIAITNQKIQSADLILAMFDATQDNLSLPLDGEGRVAANLLASCNSGGGETQDAKNNKNRFKNNVLYVANKSDKLTKPQTQTTNTIYISAKNKTGIDELLDSIYQIIQDKFTSNTGPIITRHRYRQALERTVEHLNNFSINNEIELASEDIRLATRELGKITGKVEVTDILNKIFSDFCIGK